MRPQIRTAPRWPRCAAEPGGVDPPQVPEYGDRPPGGASPGDMIAVASPRVRADAVPLAAQARLTQVYETHVDRLTAFARLLTGDATAAEDLAHEVFTDLLRRLVDDPAYLRDPAWPWLRTAVTHLASKRHRAAMHELQRLMRVYEPPRESDPWSESTVDFARAIGAMPPRMRACVTLTYIEDLSAKQVGEALGMEVRTVETHLRRARTRLRDSLGIVPRSHTSPSLQEPRA